MIYFKIVKSYVPFEYDLFVYVGFFLNQRRGSFMFFVLNINVSIKEDMRINYLDISVAVSLFFIFFCGVHTCIANTLVNRSEN